MLGNTRPGVDVSLGNKLIAETLTFLITQTKKTENTEEEDRKLYLMSICLIIVIDIIESLSVPILTGRIRSVHL